MSDRRAKKNVKSVSDENFKTDIQREGTKQFDYTPRVEKLSVSEDEDGNTPTKALKGMDFASFAGAKKGGAGGNEGRVMGGKGSQPMMANAVSDKQEKKNVKSDMKPGSFLDALKAYSYEYKNPDMPGAGEGRFVSVMAQDLEKAGPVGKSMVQDTPQGKIVDYGKGFGAMLAAQVELNERLKQIEQKYGKGR
jgi:hypothetical protein